MCAEHSDADALWSCVLSTVMRMHLELCAEHSDADAPWSCVLSTVMRMHHGVVWRAQPMDAAALSASEG